MKKISVLLFAFALLIGINGCQKINELTSFDLGPWKTTFTVPGVGLPANLPNFTSLADSLIPTGSTTSFSLHGTNTALVDKISMKEMKLTLDSAATDMNFLKDIELWIKADGLDSVRVAYYNNVPDGVKTITLTMTDVNMKEYIAKDKFSLTPKVKLDAVPSKSTKMEISQTYHVEAIKL